ncbi:MAG: manganese efflux pump MntP family protein [Dehalococcoidales bacterium]
MSNSGFLSILVIAIGLSADCFAVALGASIARKNLRTWQGLRVALAFGLFQSGMIIIGWLAGRTVINLISAYDHWLAFGLLLFVGGRMIWESFHEKDGRESRVDITRWFVLFTLSVATSLDALAVGLSFAFLDVNLALASVTIGLVAFIITIFGFLAGKKLGELVGKRAEIVGGIILILIGIRILLEHLLA